MQSRQEVTSSGARSLTWQQKRDFSAQETRLEMTGWVCQATLHTPRKRRRAQSRVCVTFLGNQSKKSDLVLLLQQVQPPIQNLDAHPHGHSAKCALGETALDCMTSVQQKLPRTHSRVNEGIQLQRDLDYSSVPNGQCNRLLIGTSIHTFSSIQQKIPRQLELPPGDCLSDWFDD